MSVMIQLSGLTYALPFLDSILRQSYKAYSDITEIEEVQVAIQDSFRNFAMLSCNT